MPIEGALERVAPVQSDARGRTLIAQRLAAERERKAVLQLLESRERAGASNRDPWTRSAHSTPLELEEDFLELGNRVENADVGIDHHHGLD